jgi:hypothetical protein
MHIAVSVSSGSSIFGKYLPTSPSKVIFISGEDDANELKRRLHKVATNLPANINQNVKKNLHFIDLADSFELFTERSSKGEVSITKVPEKICSQIKAIVGDEVGLVIIDPISRFRGGEENLAADTTRFVQALQQIRDRLNACVLTLHHVNKQSGGNGVTQNNARGSSAFIDGVRLVYPMQDDAMRFMNLLGNKFFSMIFTWLLGQPIRDTLCGTKVLWREDYKKIEKNRSYFGDFDPFGDFDLLFGAAKLKLKIMEIPIRYGARHYGSTNISRWRHGWLLLKMSLFAAKKIKFT